MLANVHRVPQESVRVREDVGSELANIIPAWAVAGKAADCGCKDYEAKMNRWGIDGCIANETQIIEHLVKQTDKLIPLFRKIPESGRRAMAKTLLSKAIEKTKKSI
jgi:hypothetical protein